MKPITYQNFIAQAGSSKMQPAYLIIGDDGYMTDKTFITIKEIVKRDIPSYELLTLYGDELTVSEISEYIDSYSLFSENRILVIRNAERLGEENKNRKQPEKQKKILELIAEYLQSPESSQVLILFAESVDSRLAGWKKLKELCYTIECEAIRFTSDIRAWLDTTLRDKRLTMDGIAKDLFQNKVELDLCTAQNELDKLITYIGDRKTITADDVKATLPTTRVGTSTDFYKSLGNKNTKEVLNKIYIMLENEWVDLQILSNINRFFVTIWKIHSLKAKHLSNQEIATSHLKEVFDSQKRDYLAFASNFEASKLPKIFEIIMETDSQIKLSMAESEILLTSCILRICNEC
jgi:DNA polymerase-3 subunit delta